MKISELSYRVVVVVSNAKKRIESYNPQTITSRFGNGKVQRIRLIHKVVVVVISNAKKQVESYNPQTIHSRFRNAKKPREA